MVDCFTLVTRFLTELVSAGFGPRFWRFPISSIQAVLFPCGKLSLTSFSTVLSLASILQERSRRFEQNLHIVHPKNGVCVAILVARFPVLLNEVSFRLSEKNIKTVSCHLADAHQLDGQLCLQMPDAGPVSITSIIERRKSISCIVSESGTSKQGLIITRGK